MEQIFPTITTLVVSVISSYFADDGTPQHLFFGLHIADWLGGLQQKELRENDGGEPVIEGSWTNNVANVSKSSPCWVLPTI